MKLQRAAGGADEVAEDGDVGAVDTDAAGIDREAKSFGLFEIDTCVVQFGKAETLCGQNAIEARRIHGTGRTMTAPRTPCYLVELLPVAFLPGRHTVLLCCCPSLFRSFLLHFLLPVLCFYSLLRLLYGVGCGRFQKGSPCPASTHQPDERRQESLCYRRDDTTHLWLRAIFLG